MNLFTINNFKIPSLMFNNEALLKEYSIKTNSSAVAISNPQKQSISLNEGDSKILFQIDGTIYTSIKKKVNTDIYVTYPEQISGNGGFTIHDDKFSQEDILKDLIGISIEEESDDYVECDVRVEDDKATIEFKTPDSFTVEVTNSGVTIEGSSVEDNFTYESDKVTIKGLISNSEIWDTIKKDRVAVELLDSDSNEYYIEYNTDNNTFTKKDIVFDGVKIDVFSSVLNIVKDTNLGISRDGIYDFDTEEYISSNQHKIIQISDNIIREFSISRILSALVSIKDSVVVHDYGYFLSSDIMFPGYVYVGSSYAYVSYYRSSVKKDDCTYSDDVGVELALKLKVKKGKGVTISKDKTTKTELTHSDGDFATDLFNSIKKGVGVWYNKLFKLKKYKDDGTKITVVYNYKNSDNNYTLTIDDQKTRFVLEDTRKVDGDTSTETKRYYRYKTYPIVEFSNTKTQVNMFKKIWYDVVADPDDLGQIYAGSIQTGAYQVVEKNSMVMLNPYNFDYKFRREKVPVDTLARVLTIQDDESKVAQIIYQPATGAIFTKIDDEVMLSSDYVDFFNSNTDHFKAHITCDYSKITYKNLDNEDKSLEFAISTYFIAEPLNGPNGMYYRVYYKNVKDVGYIEAIKYKIEE